MKDEMGQPSADHPDMFRVMKPGTWACGCCGSMLTAVGWRHYDRMVKLGFQDYKCDQYNCTQIGKICRIPIETHLFPVV